MNNNSSAILPYLEFNLTDHCNLNCKGCTHFCAIANQNYLAIDSFYRDIKRLADIFTTIAKIRILGGEPLLHPLITDIVNLTRGFFPDSAISLVTNGILLPAMKPVFYETLQKNKVTLDISVYPVTRENLSSYILQALKYKIPMKLNIVDKFCKMINAAGDSDQNDMFNQCWVRKCTFLRNGKIYHCCLPALAGAINKKFNLNIPGDDYIDIHSNVSAADILAFLNRSSSACSFCKKPIWFPWQISEGKVDEWLI